MCWPEPDRPGKKKGANAACWSTAVDSRCRSPSAAPTSTTPSCWIEPWLRSSSSALRLRDGRNYQYLCLDAGYVGYPVSKIARKHRYSARVKSRAEERLIEYRYPDSKPRRW